MEILPVHEYLNVAPPDHEWLIRGIIARPSFVLLIGDGKSGKSTLALQAALGVARGETFLGIPCTKGRVLYVQCDVSDFTWHLMLTQFKEGGENISGDVFMIHPEHSRTYLDVLQRPTVEYLKAAKEAAEPQMVVLDLLRELHSGDEQDSTAMRIVMNSILSIFGDVGLLLVHHSSKLDPAMPADPIKSSRGSSYLPGRADNVMLLHQGRLLTKGRFGPPMNLSLRRKSSGFWSR